MGHPQQLVVIKRERYHISFACLSYFCMKFQMTSPARQIFTIGHSTHPIDIFVGMLTAHGSKRLSTFVRSHDPATTRNSIRMRWQRHFAKPESTIYIWCRWWFTQTWRGSGRNGFSAYIKFTKTDEFKYL